VVEADEERDCPEDAKAAVDEAPVGLYAPDWPGDEGERNDAGTGDDAELEYPFVSDGIDQRTDEGDGDDEMSECQPVSSVGHEGVGLVGTDDAVVNAAEPGVKGWFAGRWRRRTHMEDLIEDCGFALQREGGDAAQDQSDDEEDEPETDRPEVTC